MIKMGKPDTATREYINDSSVFADVFNYFIYDGRKVVDPNNLEKLDASTLLTVFGKTGDEETIQRYRDALKKATLMVDDNAAYIVLGIEAQTKVDYGMPIRTFLYDALQYDSQARGLKAAHKNSGDKHSEDEFVSGLYKGDKVLPVITVVVHFGAKPWDGATKLSDLYDCKHKEILEFVPEYRMNLIDPAGMTDEDFEKFSTSLGKVLKFMKLSNSRTEMKNLMETDDDYSHIDRNAARVLKECANISLDIDSDEEVIDVCKAWRDERDLVAKESSIRSAIDTARRYGIANDEILADITAQFSLTEKEAETYLLKESA
ncbi:MAG: Rpn family recombination-promoting nuclease/putative transposase [Oscillospiraceae bacterium]|nr:Rpn family recombination-promoting nuclease/putative transposase [Oscillospiraceae bacterium]